MEDIPSFMIRQSLFENICPPDTINKISVYYSFLHINKNSVELPPFLLLIPTCKFTILSSLWVGQFFGSSPPQRNSSFLSIINISTPMYCHSYGRMYRRIATTTYHTESHKIMDKFHSILLVFFPSLCPSSQGKGIQS